MNRIALGVLLTLGLSSIACTANEMARNYGGSTSITLPRCQKLVNATWKESSLWYLTRPARSGEQGEKYAFKESSSLGMMEGTVNIAEAIDKSCVPQ